MGKRVDQTVLDVSRTPSSAVVKSGFGLVNNRRLARSFWHRDAKHVTRVAKKDAHNDDSGQQMVTVGGQEYTAIELWHKLWNDSHPAWDEFVWHDMYTEAVEKASVQNRVFATEVGLAMYLTSFSLSVTRDTDYAQVDKAYGRRQSYQKHTMRGIYQSKCIESAQSRSVAIFYSEDHLDKAIARMPLKKSVWIQSADTADRYDCEAYGVHYQAELNQGVFHLCLCYPTDGRDQYPTGGIKKLLRMAGSGTDFMEWIYDFKQHYVQDQIRNYKVPKLDSWAGSWKECL